MAWNFRLVVRVRTSRCIDCQYPACLHFILSCSSDALGADIATIDSAKVDILVNL